MSDKNHDKNVEEKRKRLEKMVANERHEKKVRDHDKNVEEKQKRLEKMVANEEHDKNVEVKQKRLEKMVANEEHDKNVEEKRKRLEKMEANEKHEREVKEMTKRLQNMFGNMKNTTKSLKKTARTAKKANHTTTKHANANKTRKNTSTSVRIGSTLADGNCLFSAVYRALRERELLHPVSECHETLDSSSERDFIRTLRNLVASTTDFDTFFELFDEMFKAGQQGNQNSRNTIREQMADPNRFEEGQKNIIREYIFTDQPNKRKFSEKYAAYIRTDKNYASDIEFDAIKNLLRMCDIEVISHDTVQKNLSPMKYGSPVIHLYNAGTRGEGVHYEFFSFRGAKGGARSGTRSLWGAMLFPKDS